VVTADASTFESTRAADVVFADPPYAFDDWETLACRLDAEWLVAESGATIDLGETWEVIRSRSYGRTWVTIARRLHED
jgi:16S rRNA (guanine966-N2)-methyltransferase